MRKKKEKAASKQKDLQRRKETTQRNFQQPIKEEFGSEHNEQWINMGPVVVKKEVKEENSNYFDMDFEQGTIMMPINMKEETVTENKENCKQEKNTEAMDDSDDDVPLAERKEQAAKRKVESEKFHEVSKKKANGIKKENHTVQCKDVVNDDEQPSKKEKRPASKGKKKVKEEEGSPAKKMTKKEKELEEEKNVWKWWEEDSQLPDGVNWRF